MSDRLRSPRERLGGYVILPRLIDKVRLHAQGLLPEPYVPFLLRPGLPLDGRFLAFTGLQPEALRQAVLSNDDDEAILAWVTATALLHTSQEIEAWSDGLVRLQPDRALARLLGRLSPELAKQVEFTQHPLFDLIDMDERRRPVPVGS
ncbi:MAG: DUF5069 domain-containing protein [Nitrospira sp.]|nr:DUF5069 domain-containing protein [Nitrospira sp.]MCC7470101.1 DUF5069 domain-containing protein [Candidatus Nomurabacteria bacterium]